MRKINVCDGKYTVCLPDTGDETLHALRNGEPWRDCNGDNLVFYLAVELELLRAKYTALVTPVESIGEMVIKLADMAEDNGDIIAHHLRRVAAGDLPHDGAFLTGSRAYGTPHANSDVDIVVYGESYTDRGKVMLQELSRICDERTNLRGVDDYSDATRQAFRVGDLNIIVAYTIDEYEAWKHATLELMNRAPVTRDDAIACIEKWRRELSPESLQ